MLHCLQSKKDHKMYKREKFGVELLERINKRMGTEEIGSWAFSFYMSNMLEIDLEFRKFLLKLAIMEEGQEFARTYEELENIADRLIAGEDVKL